MLFLGNHEFCIRDNSFAYYKSTEIINFFKKHNNKHRKKDGPYSITKALRKIIRYFMAISCNQVYKNPKRMD